MNKKNVRTPSFMSVDKSFNDERFMRIRADLIESGVPARGHKFRFSAKAVEEAKKSVANIPFLARVIVKKDKDGNETLDYNGHDFHVEDNKFKSGEEKIIYDEVPVGVIPESNDLEVWTNDAGHSVLSVTAYLYKDYGNYCCDILEARDGITDLSVEVDIGDDLKYIEDEKINETDHAFLYGVTLLGEDVEPAIESAHAELLSSDQKFLSIIRELKESLDKYTEQNNKRKEDHAVKFDELLKKYNLSKEDVTFDYESMSDEELESELEKLSASKNTEPEPTGTPEKNTVEMSVKLNGKELKLSRSLSDVIFAITDLVNTTYASEGDYYSCNVYDDGSAKSKYVIMCGCYGGHSYKQSWGLKDGNYVLKGDREEVFSEWLTSEERDKLNSMRSNYSSLSTQVDGYREKLEKYEAEPEKLSILQSEDYKTIIETPDYAELLNNHFDLSKEELSSKLDSILLTQYKSDIKSKLSMKKPDEKGLKMFPSGGITASRGRYGGAFTK